MATGAADIMAMVATTVMAVTVGPTRIIRLR